MYCQVMSQNSTCGSIFIAKTFCRSGGSGGPLKRVPPVYLQGTAGLAVGYAINLATQTKSHLITLANQTMSHHIISSQTLNLQATS